MHLHRRQYSYSDHRHHAHPPNRRQRAMCRFHRASFFFSLVAFLVQPPPQRDERVLIIWSDSLDRIIPTCNDFEDRLIKLLWRSRPAAPSTLASHTTSPSMHSASPSAAGSVEVLHVARTGTPTSRPVSFSGRGQVPRPPMPQSSQLAEKPASAPPSSEDAAMGTRDEEKRSSTVSLHARTRVKRNWYGKKIGFVTTPPSSPRMDLEQGQDPEMEVEERDKRSVQMYSPVYNGLAAALALGTLLTPYYSLPKLISIHSVHRQRNEYASLFFSVFI